MKFFFLLLIFIYSFLFFSCSKTNTTNNEPNPSNCLDKINNWVVELNKKADEKRDILDIDSSDIYLSQYNSALDSLEKEISTNCYKNLKLNYHLDCINNARYIRNKEAGLYHIEKAKNFLGKKNDKDNGYFYLLSGRLLHQIGNDSAFNYLKKAENIFSYLQDTNLMYKAGHFISSCYLDEGNNIECIRKAKAIIPLAKISGNLKELYNLMGCAYQNLGHYTKSLKYYSLSLKLAQNEKDISFQNNLFNNIAVVEKDIENYKSALNHIDSCINIGKKHNSSILGIAYQNKAQILSKGFDNHQQALEYLLKAKKTVPIKYLLNDFGVIYMNLKMFNLAEESFLESIKIASDNNEIEHLAFSFLGLGESYQLNHRFNLAEENLNKSLPLFDSLRNYDLMIYTTNLLEKNARLKGDYQKAYEWLNKKHNLQSILDSINNKESLLIARQNIKINQLEYNNINNQTKLKKARRKSTLFTYYFEVFLILSIILLLTLMYLFHNYNKLNSKHLKTVKQNQKLLIKNKQLTENLDFSYKNINQNKSSILHNKKDLLYFLSENNWIDFMKCFDETYAGFSIRLQTNYDSLNQNDLKFCSLIKLNCSNKEIAKYMNITDDGVKKAKQRLKSKFSLENASEVYSFLGNF